MKTISLVGPSPMLLAGLEAALLSHRNDLLIRTYPDLKIATPALQQYTPDVLIVDITLENPAAKKGFKQLISSCPQLKVIILSYDNRPKAIRNWFKTNIRGYADPTLTQIELIEAVEKILVGGRFLQAKLLAGISDEIFCINPKSNFIRCLTPRELEVIGLIVDECTTKEIAAKLYISPCTAETHRLNIIHKLGVKNTAGIVREAILQELYGY